MNARRIAARRLMVFIVAAAALFPLFFDYWNNLPDKLEQVLWQRAAREPVVSVGKIEMLAAYDAICILDPLSIRTSGKQPADAVEHSQKAMAALFGEIDYGLWEKELIKRHAHHYSWTIYAVKKGAVVQSYPLKENDAFGYQMAEGFSAGCYPANSVCVSGKDTGNSEKRKLLIGRCDE